MEHIDIAGLDLEGMLQREWLLTNGLGGYASSTICGLNTRKYHGLLVAALAPPVRRMVILSSLRETVAASGSFYDIGNNEYPGAIAPRGYTHLRAFEAEPFARWAYQADGFTLEKGVQLLPGQNTVVITYTLLAGDQLVLLELRPQMALRPMHELTFQSNAAPAVQTLGVGRHRIAPTPRSPEVFFSHDGEFFPESVWYLDNVYRREQERGYASLEDLWMPGPVRFALSPGQTAHFVCSTDPIDMASAIACAEFSPGRRGRGAVALPSSPGCTSGASEGGLISSDDPILSDLTRAVEKFVLHPDGPQTTAITSGYPWPSPSGREAMIAFPGMFLATGRFEQGRRALFDFATLLEEGLLPSAFPEDGGPPVYQGADVSLWFIAAVDQYMRYTADDSAAAALLETVQTIIAAYRRGMALGISVEPDDLLSSRQPQLATTWMDAAVNDWVITPRQGLAVEINALWYNALLAAAELAGRVGRNTIATDYAAQAARVKASFNRRFWNPQRNCCYDVLDSHGADPSIRPNQILAISLPHAVLDAPRQATALWTVMMELLTPLGVRTLGPRDPGYQGRHEGNIVSRDRARHNGSAFPWLLGPLASAYLRVHGRTPDALQRVRNILEPSLRYLRGDGMGCLPELFSGNSPVHPTLGPSQDAESRSARSISDSDHRSDSDLDALIGAHAIPAQAAQRPGGAIASAASVAELLRCYREDVLGDLPGVETPVAHAAVSR